MRELKLEKDFKYYIKKVGFCLLFLSVIVIMTCGCSGGKDDIGKEDLIPSNLPQDAASKDGSADSTKLNAEEKTATLDLDEVDPLADTDKMTKLSVEDFGRANPFLPPGEVDNATRNISSLPFELVDPPEDGVIDSDASRVIRTKVSGILFDEHHPAAILNMEGTDYLVRTGDVIDNYKVLAIYKNNVAVQLGDNIYKAGVGELLVADKINYNVVPNLDNRFGGSSTNMKIKK